MRVKQLLKCKDLLTEDRFLNSHDQNCSPNGLERHGGDAKQFENPSKTEQLYLECLIPSMKTSGPNGTGSVFASEGLVTEFRNF